MAKTETFKSFTDKWKKYVEDNKEASEITEEDWKQFFAPSNPVAGINFGALTDKLKLSKQYHYLVLITKQLMNGVKIQSTQKKNMMQLFHVQN